MTNSEVLQQYNTERWVVEQTLCFLLQEYWERNGDGHQMPENPVGFVKNFMKEETLCSIEFAEKSKMNTLEKGNIIDAEFIEVINEEM